MPAQRLFSGLLAASLALTTGCATMMNGGPSVVDVAVEHPRQHVTTTVTATATQQRTQQTTPDFQYVLDKGSDYVLTVQSPGYQAEQVAVKRSLHPAFWGDLAWLSPLAVLAAYMLINARGSEGLGYVLGPLAAVTAPVGLVATLVDTANGSLWTHDPRQVRVRLLPDPSKP